MSHPHSGPITSLAFVDGALLSTSTDGTARLGDVVFPGHSETVNAAVAVEARVITVSDDGGVRFFDRESGELVVLANGHTGRVTKIEATKTGVVTTGDDGSTRHWKLDGKPGRVVQGAPKNGTRQARGPLSIALGKGVKAEANADGSVVLVGKGQRKILGAHDDDIVALTLSDDGQTLASAAADGSIRVWSWAEAWALGGTSLPLSPPLERIWATRPLGPGNDLFFEAGELWAGLANTLQRLDLETGKSLQKLGAPGEIVHFGPTAAVFVEQQASAHRVDRETGKVDETPLENGRLYFRTPLAWTTGKPDSDNTLRILDPEANTLTTLGPMKGPLDAHAIRADGSLAVVAASDAPEAWFWNVADGTLLGHAKWPSEDDEGAYQMAFTHDGGKVVIGTQDGTIYVHDARTGERIRELVSPAQDGPRLGEAPICVSPATDRVVGWGGDEHHAILFDLESGAPLAKLLTDEPNGYAKEGIAFSPDGKRLAIAHATSSHLAFYDAMTGARLSKHAVHRPAHNSVQFRWLDSARVLTFSRSEEDHSLRLWDATAGERIWTNLGIGGRAIGEVVFSPGGRFIAVTASDWDFVRILAVTTGKTLVDLPHPKGAHVRRPAFSADDTLVATTTNAGPVNLWRLPESNDSGG